MIETKHYPAVVVTATEAGALAMAAASYAEKAVAFLHEAAASEDKLEEAA